jgi:hypothetical protein
MPDLSHLIIIFPASLVNPYPLQNDKIIPYRISPATCMFDHNWLPGKRKMLRFGSTGMLSALLYPYNRPQKRLKSLFIPFISGE